MNQTERYEAAILGTDPAALYAGYLLKKHKIKFVFVDMEPEAEPALPFPFEQTLEQWELVQAQLNDLLASVGVEDFSMMDEKDENRLVICLRASLEAELNQRRVMKSLQAQEGYYVALCPGSEDAAVTEWDMDTLELDVIIAEHDIVKAGVCAEAVYHEKQLRLNAYRERLRIQEATRDPRKLVYVTQSKSWYYAREAVMQYALEQGIAPVNPFMNFGYYLQERVDREEITASCHQLIRAAEEMWVFGPISEATLTEIVVAVMEGKEIRFFSISEIEKDIKEIPLDKITFEREVHAGQIHKSDLLDFIRSTAPRTQTYKQMTLFG